MPGSGKCISFFFFKYSIVYILLFLKTDLFIWNTWLQKARGKLKVIFHSLVHSPDGQTKVRNVEFHLNCPLRWQKPDFNSSFGALLVTFAGTGSGKVRTWFRQCPCVCQGDRERLIVLCHSASSCCTHLSAYSVGAFYSRDALCVTAGPMIYGLGTLLYQLACL